MFLAKKYKGIYYLYFEDESGKRKSISTKCKLKTDALKFLTDFQAKKDNIQITVNIDAIEFKERVLYSVKSSQSFKSYKSYLNVFDHFIRIIGNKPIKNIGTKDLEQYKNVRLSEVHKATVNGEISRLKASFQRAIDWNLLNNNPAKILKKISIEQREPLCFNENEIKIILETIDTKDIKNIVLFNLYTGCRINEILNIQWKDIDFSDMILTIRNKSDFKTKSGKLRQIPISDNLKILLNSLQQNNSANNIINYHEPEKYIFSDSKNNKFDPTYISKCFKYFLRIAGIPEKFHFHCLRHTFITNLIKKGVNINYVKELAGHSSITTTMHYIHIVTNDLRSAVNLI